MVKFSIGLISVMEYEACVVSPQKRVCEVAVAAPVAAGRFSEYSMEGAILEIATNAGLCEVGIPEVSLPEVAEDERSLKVRMCERGPDSYHL